MRTPLIALVLLAVPLPLGCSAEEVPPDPLARRAGFCQAWGEAACQADVVEYCNATSVDDCIERQSDFCLGILPENYNSERAEQCLKAVKTAYSDADLSAEELQVVRYLAAPCDQLSEGISTDGESCGANDDCNTAAGFSCIIKLGGAEGTCAKPEVVTPGRSCDEPAQVCDDEFFCNGENCVAYKDTGDACAGDYECAPADRCVIAADTEMGECTARVATGEVCSADADCESRYCAIEPAETEGACAQVIRLAINEPLCEDLR